MSGQSEFAPKITSGVDVVDRAWGGLFRGGSYLVYGRVSNGRGLLALAFEQAGVAMGERSMLVSNTREKDLQIQSTAIGFNVARANDEQLFKHVRTNELSTNNPSDSSARIKHLIRLILDFKPARLVVNDLVSLINVGQELSLGDFRRHFVQLLEEIEPIDTTAVFTLPDPGNDSARKLAEFIMSRCAGAIHVGARDRDSEGYKLTLLPQIGHVTRRTVVPWPLHDVVSRFEDIEQSYRALLQQRADATYRLNAGHSIGDGPHGDDDIELTAKMIRPETTRTYVETNTDTVEAATIDDLATGLTMTESFAHPPEGSQATGADADQGTATRTTTTLKRSISDFQNREIFHNVLENEFHKLKELGGNFLLVAMRVDPSREPVRPFDFEFLAGVVLETLRDKDEAFVDLTKERVVLLFPDSNADDSQEFFSRVRERLRRDAPQQASHLLNLVSAIVVPNGNPFNGAERFLNYVLDSN